MKRLLLLLCLMVTAGSAAWADIASGNCKNGTWKIDNTGTLRIDIDGKMADYGEGKAPWYDYADQIKGIHIGSGCKNVGQHGFHGLVNVTSVTGGDNVEGIGYYAFEDCGLYAKIPEIYLPKCDYLGEGAFRSCGAVRIVLPVVKEVRRKAFYSCPYLIQVDLGSKIESIGVLAFSECPQMWADDTPNIFMSNPNPPTLWTKVEASAADKAKAFFKDLGKALAVVGLFLLPGGTFVIGNYMGEQDLINKEQGFEQPYERYFSLDDVKDAYYNPFAPKTDGEGWTDGEPIICVPANLVDTYRDYYVGRTVESEHRGYICDHYKGMGVDWKVGYGAIMAGGKIGTSFDQGYWMLQSRNSVNKLECTPDGTNDALVIGGDMQNIGMSAVNGQKSKAKALYIGSKSTFPEGAFQGWTNLDYVYMAEKSWISDRMFKDCTNLERVDADAQSTGLSAFEGCTKLRTFNGGTEIKNVAASAFKDCTNLWEVVLPRVKQIQEKAFMGCSQLRRVVSSGLSSENLQYTYDIEEIGESAFEGCGALWEISFQNLRQLGKRAFYGCSSLIEFTSGPYFTTVPEEAFANSSIKRIMHNGSSYSFASKSFAGCSHLVDGSFADSDRGIFDSHVGSISSVASDAFGSLALKNIPLHCAPEAWARTYQNDPVLGKMKYMDYDIEYNWTVAKDGWELTQSGILTVGNRFSGLYKEKIEDYPWYPYIDRIKKVLIDDGATQIYKGMFAGMTRVTDVHVPRTVKIIDEGAFKGCTALKNIYIYNVENIGSNAFEECSSLATIELGENLKKAGDYIFKNCTSLTYVVNMTDTPAEVTDLTFKEIKSGVYAARGDQAMQAPSDGGQSEVTLKVSDAHVVKYMTNKNWSKFHISYADGRGTWMKAGNFGDGMWVLYDDGTMVVSADKGPGIEATKSDVGFGWGEGEAVKATKRLEFKGNITEIGPKLFTDFENLEEVKLSQDIKKLADDDANNGVFRNCHKLTSINMAQLEYIGANAFAGTALSQVDLANAKYIGQYAFYDCQNLKAAALKGNVEVGVGAFQKCSALQGIDLGQANLNEARGCFKDCENLEMVMYNGTKVPEGMFEGCAALRYVDLGSRIMKVENRAFAGCYALDSIVVCTPTAPVAEDRKFTQDGVQYWASPFSYTMSWDPRAAYDHSVDIKKIHLVIPCDFVSWYKKYSPWKEMNIGYDEEEADPALPTGGSIGKNGTWELDETGTLTIDYEGNMPQFDELGASTWRWKKTFDRWASFTENIRYTDGLTSIAQDVTDNEAEAGLYSNIKTLEIGTNVESIGANAMRYTDLTDVYCFASEPPAIATSDENGTFDKAALIAKGTTLHVVDFYGTLDKYQKSSSWNWFPKIVADLPTRKPGTVMVERVNVTSATGTWLSVESSQLGKTTLQLEASVYPANADNTAVVWTSEDERVATVDENGLVTILAYPEMMEVGITATAADGSNRKGTVSLRIINPDHDWGSVLCQGMDVDRKTITIMKSQEPVTLTVRLTPANSTANIDFDVDNFSMLQVVPEYDDRTGRRTGVFHISAPDPMMVPEVMTGSTTIHFYTHYYDENFAQPDVFVNVNIIDDVVFTEENAQDVPVTYAVTTLDGNTCTVYGQWVDGHDEDGIFIDSHYATAIDQGTTGLVTVPAKARNYYVTGVGMGAFNGCSGIETVAFDEGIQFVGGDAFTGCNSLREVRLPESIKAFGSMAFANLPNLKDVHIQATTPPTGGGVYPGYSWAWPMVADSRAFEGLSGATLHVPAGCKDAYNVAPWNVWFANITDASDAVLGDANGDGKVDVSDYIGVANHILGNTPEGFDEKAADVDHNNVIDVSDYIGVANIILTGSVTGNNARALGGETTGTDISGIDNVIYVKDFSDVKAGDEFELSFQMKNKAAIRGFQFDLYLPAGMEAVKTAKGKYQAAFNQSRLPEDDEHTMTLAEQSDGAIRILCGSQYDETFTGNDGELFTLKVKLSADMADGTHTISLKNQKLTETDITKFYETELVEAAMKVGSGAQTGTDISDMDNVIYVKDFTGVKAGDEFELPFSMKNLAAIRGFQFDLYLPTGMEAVKTAKGKYQATFNQSRLPEDDEHTLTVAEQSDGAIRILCGSQYDETFTGSDGELFTLKVKLSADMADGQYVITLKNQKLTETDITKFYETELVEGIMTLGEGSGINAVFADQKTGRIFDLQGRRVLTPGKGLYIRNGKKVVMK